MILTLVAYRRNSNDYVILLKYIQINPLVDFVRDWFWKVVISCQGFEENGDD